MKYNDFKDMPIWQKAMEIAVEIHNLTVNLPKKEDYGFTSQIRRSGLSISANIAEGFGRYHKLDKVRFYYIARGSITETRSHLDYGFRVGYLTKDSFTKIDTNLKEIHFELNTIIKSLYTNSKSQS
jgi:four helix bundle protein